MAVLEAWNPGDREDIHVVYLGQGGPPPARVRAFIDFLAAHVRIEAMAPAGPDAAHSRDFLYGGDGPPE